MPTVTVGVAVWHFHGFFEHPWEFGRGYLCVFGTHDPATGWIDSQEVPVCSYGLQYTIDSIVGVLSSEWLGHTVNLHWELDSGTRADLERLDLTLPAHLHVEPDPPRRPNPDTWTVTFDDPPF